MTVAYSDTASGMWQDLKKRYSVANAPKIHQLNAAIANCKQSNLDVGEFYSKLTNLWNELANHIKVPICTCSGCKCGAAGKIIAMYEEDKTHQFLMGLNDDGYSQIRSQILAQEPLPSLDRIFNMVMQEENHKNVMLQREGKTENAAAFAVNISKSVQAQGDRPTCKHCGKRGHEEANCFEIIGYPAGWMPRGGGHGRGRGRRGRGGRTGSERGRANLAVHALPSRTEEQHGADSQSKVEPESAQYAASRFTPEQFQKLLSLIDVPKSGCDKLSGKGEWILDSGASCHMTGNLGKLSNVHDTHPILVELPNGDTSLASRQGWAQLNSTTTLSNVLYVPDLNCNLVSIAQLTNELFCTVIFTKKWCVIQDHTMKRLIGVGEQRRGVYFFTEDQPGAVSVNKVVTHDLWHRRLGHPSKKVMSLLSNDIRSCDGTSSTEFCDVCFRAKQTRSSFPNSINKVSECFELIHCDIWGAYRTESLTGAHYFLSIVDDASSGTWVYLMREKREASQIIKKFCMMVKTQFRTAVKIIRSDNGSEFISGPMLKFYEEFGIVHQTTCFDTHQQNGRVERKHRHILNVAQALRFQANLPLRFWGECILTAAYLINRTPTFILQGKTPYEILFRAKPTYDNIKVFGCLCYVHRFQRQKDKFASHSRKCLFLGYPFGKKGWKVYDLETGEVFVSRDVIFQEENFPFEQSQRIKGDAIHKERLPLIYGVYDDEEPARYDDPRPEQDRPRQTRDPPEPATNEQQDGFSEAPDACRPGKRNGPRDFATELPQCEARNSDLGRTQGTDLSQNPDIEYSPDFGGLTGATAEPSDRGSN